MSPRAFFVVGIIAAVVVMAFALSNMGGESGTERRGYRGSGGGSPTTATSPANPTTASGPGPTAPTTAGNPTAPARHAEGRLLRPGEADGATDEKVAEALKVFKGAPKKSTDAPSPTYTVAKGGESIYDVARKWLGDETYGRKLYDANRGVIANPDKIAGGTVLLRPDSLDDDDGVARIPGIGSGIR